MKKPICRYEDPFPCLRLKRTREKIIFRKCRREKNPSPLKLANTSLLPDVIHSNSLSILERNLKQEILNFDLIRFSNIYTSFILLSAEGKEESTLHLTQVDPFERCFLSLSQEMKRCLCRNNAKGCYGFKPKVMLQYLHHVIYLGTTMRRKPVNIEKESN